MRALLCDYVGADRADQVAHKSYVPRRPRDDVFWVRNLELTDPLVIKRGNWKSTRNGGFNMF